MPNLFKNLLITVALGAAAGGALPAVAQTTTAPTVEELTIMGRYGVDPNTRSLSQVVSYADLDLRTAAGQDELKRRVSLTARWLCEKLGETNTTSSVGLSCRDAAVKDAMEQARVAIASYPPRPAGWAIGPAWTAPYPSAWTYP